jgi:acyl-CoA dehydrogenase
MSSDSESQRALRAAASGLCRAYPASYWRELDRTGAFPEAFLRAFTEAGFVGTLVPEDDGGSGLGTGAAAVILEEIHASGADGAIAHAAMNAMTAFLRHASPALKARWLPRILSGERRFLAFGVTEPDAGTDTTQIATVAVRDGDGYRVRGRKLWISHAEHTDLMLLLVRTTPRGDCARRTDGLTLLLVDARSARGHGLTVSPVSTMVNHHSTECVFDDLFVPADHLVGTEGAGFRHILDGMNAERILIAAECIGDARWFIEQATAYAKARRVFDRPIGQNQAVQFPLADSYAQVHAARLVVEHAAAKFDCGAPCSAEANIAKLLASQASYRAGDVCLQTFGGMGFATEADVERKFRETRLYAVAPVSNNLVLAYLAQQVLGLPRAY